MKRETEESIKDSIISAFEKARIDDNGRITLDETFNNDTGVFDLDLTLRLYQGNIIWT